MKDNFDAMIEGLINSVNESCRQLFGIGGIKHDQFTHPIHARKAQMDKLLAQEHSAYSDIVESVTPIIEEICVEASRLKQDLIIDACNKTISEMRTAGSQTAAHKAITKFSKWLEYTIDSISFAEMGQPKTSRSGLNKMRCLIVEDDETARIALKTYLENQFDCECVNDGYDAIMYVLESISRKNRYDLILLDIMMPQMNGIEVLRNIRDIETLNGIAGLDRSKIIMATALDDSDMIWGAFNTGCEGYIIKPFDKDRLFAEIKKLQLILS